LWLITLEPFSKYAQDRSFGKALSLRPGKKKPGAFTDARALSDVLKGSPLKVEEREREKQVLCHRTIEHGLCSE